MLSGSVRPKVFVSEPSLVAVAYFVLAVASTWTVRKRIVSIEVMVLTVIEYYLLGSPILILAILGVLPTYRFSKRGLSRLLSFVLIGIVLSLTYYMISGDLSNRFSDLSFLFDSGGDEMETQSSESLRLINPFVSLVDVLNINPISGLGIGGKESLALFSTFFTNYEVAFGNNSFATLFIFGFIGALCFFYHGDTYADSLISHHNFYSLYFLYMQTMGGFESARMWTYMAIIVASTGTGVGHFAANLNRGHSH